MDDGTCYAYGCTDDAVVELNAWGPGEVRAFCEPHAELRRPLRGYAEVNP